MSLQGITDDALVLPQQLPRLRVAQPLGEGRRALHIREQDGPKSARVRRLRPCCGLPKGLWESNNGEGYVANGRIYCCRGCAEGTLCTCRR